MQFTHIRERGGTPGQDFEELRLGVPKFRLHELLEHSRLGAPSLCEVRLSGPLGDPGNGLGVAVLVAVDGGAAAAATN